MRTYNLWQTLSNALCIYGLISRFTNQLKLGVITSILQRQKQIQRDSVISTGCVLYKQEVIGLDLHPEGNE